jgi:outer membrane protein TolC
MCLCLPAPVLAQDETSSGALAADQEMPRVAEVEPSVTVTLADAVNRALARSPQLAQAENSLLVSETGRKTLWGSFIPSVNSSVRVNTQSSERFDPDLGISVSGASDSYTAGLSGGLSLFEGGGRYYDLKRSQADIDGATARLEDQTAQVVFQTKSLFFGAVASRELLDVAQARLERARTGLDVVRRQVEVGSGTRSDLLRSQLELQNAQLGVLQTAESLRAAQFALGRQIGESRPVGPVVDMVVGPRPLGMSETEIFVAAEEASPAVRAAVLASESTRLQVSSSRTSWLPTLNANGSWSWFNDDPAFSGGNSSWSVSVSAQYPIFTGFNRGVQIERAREDYRVATLQETDARLAARQDADRALQAVYTAEQALQIAVQSLAVAEEDLRVVSERYRVGVAIILDVLASQEAVTQAGADVVRARFDYEVARADLEAILGREL